MRLMSCQFGTIPPIGKSSFFMSTVRCNFDITTLWNEGVNNNSAQNKEYKLCSPYSAGRKSGRPRGGGTNQGFNGM